MFFAGFRDFKYFNNVTEAEFDKHGSYACFEVENNNDTEVIIKVNDFEHQGKKASIMHVSANRTRYVPITIYNIKTSAPVNIIAYRK